MRSQEPEPQCIAPRETYLTIDAAEGAGSSTIETPVRGDDAEMRSVAEITPGSQDVGETFSVLDERTTLFERV